MHNVGRIAVCKLWDRHTDEFNLILLEDLNILFNCLVSSSWGICGGLIQDDVILDVLQSTVVHIIWLQSWKNRFSNSTGDRFLNVSLTEAATSI